MVKCPDKHNLREKDFILAYSSRGKQPIGAEKTQTQSGKAGAGGLLVTMHPYPGSKSEQEVRLGSL